MSGDTKRTKLGRILLKRKLLSHKELEGQLESQRDAQDGVPLASRLTESGLIAEMDVLRALSEQLGVPGIDLNQIAVASECLSLVPREVAETGRLLPVLARDDRLFLAMADPRDRRVIDELEFVTGRRVYPYVAIATTLERAIRDAYNAKESGKTHYAGPNAPAESIERLGHGRGPPSGGHDPRASIQERDSVAPDALSVVVDQKMETVAAEGDLSTSDFGMLDDSVSKVTTLTDEARDVLSANATSSNPGGKRILVVDDEIDIRKLLRRLLTEKGHHVILADRGTTALRLVKEERPDVILLDAMLPEIHGFDIAKRIKGSDKYGSIPILMMSAIYRGWRIAQDLKANYGIEDYIEKPFRIGEILAKVARLVEHRGRTDADPEQMNRDAEQCLREGIAAYKNGDIELAIAMLRKGITVDPLAYRLRYHLALIYGKQGLIYDGITELEHAADLNPKHFPALKNLAVLYEKAGFRHKAVETWERCMQVAPDAETRESIKAHVVKLL